MGTWVDFQAVKQAVSLGQVLERYGVKLKRTGKELQRFSLGSPIRVAQIVPGTLGKDGSILILTADQIVHRLPLPAANDPQSALSTNSAR